MYHVFSCDLHTISDTTINDITGILASDLFEVPCDDGDMKIIYKKGNRVSNKIDYVDADNCDSDAIIIVSGERESINFKWVWAKESWSFHK